MHFVPATLNDKHELEKLYGEYLTELCEKSGIAVPEADPYFDLYWEEPERWPFIMREDGAIIAFALVRRNEDQQFEIAEFYVRPASRRKGIGKEMMLHLYQRFAGPWLIQYFKANAESKDFWRAVVGLSTSEVKLVSK